MAGRNETMDASRRRLERALQRGEEPRAGKVVSRVEVLPPESPRDRIRQARAARARGFLLGAAAASMLVVGLLRARALWWLLFVAYGFGSAAMRSFERAARLREPEREAPPLETDPRDRRIDELCAKLRSELADGPRVLEELLHRPEQTIEALRQSCHALTRRERALRAHLASRDAEGLQAERQRLAERTERESDAVTRDRLSGALAAMDEQLRQRAEIERAANRLEAEHTRLTWTLENLYSQIVRVRSADDASREQAGASLKESVSRLGAEMEAIAEALETVTHDDALRR